MTKMLKSFSNKFSLSNKEHMTELPFWKGIWMMCPIWGESASVWGREMKEGELAIRQVY